MTHVHQRLVLRLPKDLRKDWLVYLILSAILLIALVVRVKYATDNPMLDDAFITFRYVRNLAHGLGFVYNPGERILGTTTPLYALLLTPFAVAGADFVVAGKIVNILASTVTVFVVFLIARRVFGNWPAILAAMLMAISTNNVWAASTGMETELNVLILLLFIYAYLSQRYSITAALAAVALVTRPDDLILVGVIFAWQFTKVIFRKQSAESFVRPFAIFVLCLLPWLIFATLYFGSPLPNSIIGKVASYRVPVSENLAMYLGQYGFALDTPRALVTTILFLLGTLSILRRRDDLIILVAYFLCYSAAFVVSGARLGSGWYWQPMWPIHSIIVAGGFCFIGQVSEKSSIGATLARFRIPIAATVVLIVALVWAGALKARFIDPRPPDDLEWAELAAAGRWINQNTAPNATVSLETIGAVGWYSNRYIIDEGGLVSPQVAKINERLGSPDFFKILQTFQPDYYLAWIHGELDLVNSVPVQEEWFAAHYHPIGTFDVGANRSPYFMLFKKTAN